ncbi:MAG: leucine-rich repeat domain-containing protein [Gammaproteobacteria bacterium]|nr:leucine-rich repeat domain-containing protein [Gammaproteobacteria bacterium]
MPCKKASRFFLSKIRIAIPIMLVFVSTIVAGKPGGEIDSPDDETMKALIDALDGVIQTNAAGQIVEIRIPEYRINNHQVEQLSENPHIQSLDFAAEYFSVGQLPEQIVTWIAGLEHLRAIKLNGHLITDIGARSISRMSDLRKLNLFGAAITDIGVAQLLALNKLEILKLGQLPFALSYRHYFRGHDISDVSIN